MLSILVSLPCNMAEQKPTPDVTIALNDDNSWCHSKTTWDHEKINNR